MSYYDSIKPLFAVHCYKCHTDAEKSGLRLDVEERARKGGESGLHAIVPGDSKRSELLQRITSRDPDERMPPKGLRLTDGEVALISRWIDEGA